MHIIKQADIETHSLKVYIDEGPHESPRDWGSMAYLCIWHRDYTLPWENKMFDAGDGDGLLKWLKRQSRYLHVKNVIGHEHGSLHFSITNEPYHNGFESGLAGYMYVRKKDIKSEKEAEKYMASELDIFNKYVNGNIYVLSIENKLTDEYDAIGGLYDIDDHVIAQHLEAYFNVKPKAIKQLIENMEDN